jgi:SAM-dependent methyltransferase
MAGGDNGSMSKAWNAFAEREPYYAVLTHPEYLSDQITEEARERFFQSGEDEVGMIDQLIRSHLAPRFRPREVLEFGCGPGRLAIPLARRYLRVTAVDAAPAMLRRAKENALREGLTNLELVTPSMLRDSGRPFNLVIALLLLQRLPPAEGLALIEELTRLTAPDGCLVLQFPYSIRKKVLSSVVGRLRRHLPLMNRTVNRLRNNPGHLPSLPTWSYSFESVLPILRASGFTEPLIQLRHDETMETALVLARKERTPAGGGSDFDRTPSAITLHDDFVDVKELIARSSLEELNRLAETYFASLDDWNHHLAKPFSRADETPQLLIGFATLLQGLDLQPGLTVLEYGAGSGWLSRFLTQLGSRAILLDVSPTALAMAQTLYDRLPPLGERPAPSFLQFDGLQIDLPDQSVDRIVCFDAFHHATNPEEILTEFARVLVPGGIAAFAEPGPFHSQSDQSQFEMRTYGVIENDVDVHALWKEAQRLGFTDLTLAAFNVPPFHLGLDEFEELLDGGPALSRWAEATATFLGGARTFFLRKGNPREAGDSSRPNGLSAIIHPAAEAVHCKAGESIPLEVTITNSGTAAWLPSETAQGGVSMGVHLYTAERTLIDLNYHWGDLGSPPRRIEVGEKLSIRLDLPPLEPGEYRLELDCVARGVGWFSQLGSRAAHVRLTITS